MWMRRILFLPSARTPAKTRGSTMNWFPDLRLVIPQYLRWSGDGGALLLPAAEEVAGVVVETNNTTTSKRILDFPVKRSSPTGRRKEERGWERGTGETPKDDC